MTLFRLRVRTRRANNIRYKAYKYKNQIHYEKFNYLFDDFVGFDGEPTE